MSMNEKDIFSSIEALRRTLTTHDDDWDNFHQVLYELASQVLPESDINDQQSMEIVEMLVAEIKRLRREKT